MFRLLLPLLLSPSPMIVTLPVPSNPTPRAPPTFCSPPTYPNCLRRIPRMPHAPIASPSLPLVSSTPLTSSTHITPPIRVTSSPTLPVYRTLATPPTRIVHAPSRPHVLPPLSNRSPHFGALATRTNLPQL